MPTVEDSITIRAPREAIFALSQDYGLRLEWDPFVRALRFPNGETEAAQNVSVWVRAKNGLTMTVKFTTFQPPERVAMTMTEGPFIFTHFAGTWRFEQRDEAETLVTFRYGFQCRRLLAPLLTPLVRRVFQKDVHDRLVALKSAAEQTDILERLARR